MPSGSIHIQRLVSERIAPDAAVMKRLVAVHAPGMGFSAKVTFVQTKWESKHVFV
jgi:hypothetical protein